MVLYPIQKTLRLLVRVKGSRPFLRYEISTSQTTRSVSLALYKEGTK